MDIETHDLFAAITAKLLPSKAWVAISVLAHHAKGDESVAMCEAEIIDYLSSTIARTLEELDSLVVDEVERAKFFER